MKCFFYALIFIFAAFIETNAQSVAINTSGAVANASSILDISSTSKGVLVPRMTKAQKNAIVTPASGLLIYQGAPDSIGFHYYNGSLWVWLNPSGGVSNDWSVTGNAGTDTALNFIGTTDNMPLAFKINNEKSGRIESNIATANTFLGFRAGRFNSGIFNTAFGNRALADSVTGITNTAFGAFALTNNKAGFANTAMGTQSLNTNTTGAANTAIGASSLLSNTIGGGNTAIGNAALQANVNGNSNTAIGASTLINNNFGSANTAIGVSTLPQNTTGSFNTAVGGSILMQNTTGSFNIGIGYSTLLNNINRSNLIAIGKGALNNNGIGVSQAFHATLNIAMGTDAMTDNTIGYNNVALGNEASKSNSSGFNNVAVGNFALRDGGGNSNTALGNSAIYNASGSNNTAVGDSALFYAGNGFNVAVGSKVLSKNVSGSNNTGVGFASLFKNTLGDNNVANGFASLHNNTTGISNTALGISSLYDNATGNNNVAIGDSAAYNSNVSGIVAIGSKALFSNTTGSQNTGVGFNSLASNTVGNYNTGLGYKSIYKNVSGNFNVAIGDSALYDNTAGAVNTAIGTFSLTNNTIAGGNTAIGSYSMRSNIIGAENIALGYGSLIDNSTGSTNVAVGNFTLENRNGINNIALGNRAGTRSISGITSFSNNIFIGSYAGYNSTGSNNVFIGDDVGTGSTLSDILAIHNSNSPTPLIFGNFATGLLRINGILNINGQYSFPFIDGSANQVLYTNGAGALSWATASSESTTANNGLTLTGSNVALGGTLLGNTAISYSNFNLTHSLNGAGDFVISTPTRPNAFTVLNSGDVAVNNNDFVVSNAGNAGINTITPVHRLHIVNTVGGLSNLSNGAMIQNTNTGSTGQATLAFKNAGPDGLPGNRAWITGMNAFDNYAIAYGDSLTGTNAIVRVDTAGYVGINPSGPPTSRLDVVGSFGNAIRVTTASTTLDVDDHTLIIGPAAGSISITLPAAGTVDRREYVIVNRSVSNQAVTSYNDFSGTSVFVAANSAITLQSNGTNWFRIQ